MATRYYPIILERVGTELHATFPDLPGLTAFGADAEDLLRHAEEGLALHIAGMVEDGTPIPPPSALDAAPVDEDAPPEAGRLLVRADLPGRAVRVNVTLDDGLLAAIDAEAKRRGTSRSGFIADVSRRELAAGR